MIAVGRLWRREQQKDESVEGRNMQGQKVVRDEGRDDIAGQYLTEGRFCGRRRHGFGWH